MGPMPIEPSSPYPPSSSNAEGNDLSPPDGRFSRDFNGGAPSISTFDTASEPRTSLERTPSRASEMFPKETFMQKLSRKSSASMFNFPMSFTSSKKGDASEKSSRFSGVGKLKTPSADNVEGATPDETDEEGTPSHSKLSTSAGSMGGLSPAVGG